MQTDHLVASLKNDALHSMPFTSEEIAKFTHKARLLSNVTMRIENSWTLRKYEYY